MPRSKLTDRAVRAFRVPERGQLDYFDDNPRGFGVRLSQGGQRSFFVMYRFEGRLRRHTLGRYPHLTLRDARQQAKNALHDVAHGRDPGAQKQATRTAETFKELASKYLELHAKKHKKTWKADERVIDTDLLPRWGKRKAGSVTRRDVRRLLAHIADERGSPIMANRTLALIRKIYNFGIGHEIVESNPCYGIERPGTEHERERVLSHEELRLVWAALTLMPRWFQVVVQLYLFTAQREDEILSMARSELEIGTGWWNIPGIRTKNELPHRVPLSEPVRDLLSGFLASSPGSSWVFPSTRKDGPRTTLQKPLHQLRETSGIDDFHIHDLRRTAASHMTSIGIARQTVGRILNHSEKGSTRVYDRYSYDREKREALDQWAGELLRIVRSAPDPLAVHPDEEGAKSAATMQYLH